MVVDIVIVLIVVAGLGYAGYRAYNNSAEADKKFIEEIRDRAELRAKLAAPVIHTHVDVTNVDTPKKSSKKVAKKATKKVVKKAKDTVVKGLQQ
jgi:hypothetical protein